MTNPKEPMVRISGNRLITTSLAVSNHFNIIDAPKNLAQQQQMALHFLPSLPANTQGGCHA